MSPSSCERLCLNFTIGTFAVAMAKTLKKLLCFFSFLARFSIISTQSRPCNKRKFNGHFFHFGAVYNRPDQVNLMLWSMDFENAKGVQVADLVLFFLYVVCPWSLRWQHPYRSTGFKCFPGKISIQVGILYS